MKPETEDNFTHVYVNGNSLLIFEHLAECGKTVWVLEFMIIPYNGIEKVVIIDQGEEMTISKYYGENQVYVEIAVLKRMLEVLYESLGNVAMREAFPMR